MCGVKKAKEVQADVHDLLENGDGKNGEDIKLHMKTWNFQCETGLMCGVIEMGGQSTMKVCAAHRVICFTSRTMARSKYTI